MKQGELFPSSNKYGFPDITKQEIDISDLIGFNYVLSSKPKGETVHFFLDDYQFERLWNSPNKYIEPLSKFNGVLGPDFSLYRNYPVALQIYNTFRNRWLCTFWQTRGLKVIPTISWSDEQSFEWCFDGISSGGQIAISTVGILKDAESLDYFMAGYDAMLKSLHPSKIYIYGNQIDGVRGIYFSPFKFKLRRKSWAEEERAAGAVTQPAFGV